MCAVSDTQRNWVVMRWLASIILGVLVSLAIAQTANAELLYESVSDIQVPHNVLMGAQLTWQGHIIYEVKDVGGRYQVKVVRDGEPHQYPYFYVSFSKDWEYLGTTRHVNPEAERKAAEDKAKADQEAARKAQEDQERQRREQEERDKPKPEKPDPPVVKPPEEEEPEEPEEPEENEGDE